MVERSRDQMLGGRGTNVREVGSDRAWWSSCWESGGRGSGIRVVGGWAVWLGRPDHRSAVGLRARRDSGTARFRGVLTGEAK